MKRFGLFLLVSLPLSAYQFAQLHLEDLTEIQIKNTDATLIKTTIEEVPASMTVITHEDIVQSGARNLDELLEIYVPSFLYMDKIYGSQIGFRGIISDRNNKVLLLVNKRVMNIKTSDGGAVTEQWFSMLDDIKKVTVITGPGSPIYGAGAIAGVISIETFDGSQQEGLRVATKGGIGERFGMASVSYASKVFDNMQLYSYYGVDKSSGATNEDAPLKFAFDYSNDYKIKAPADEMYPIAVANDGASFKHSYRHKAHIQLQGEHTLFWARFTRSSSENPTEQKMFWWMSEKNKIKFYDTGTENQQLTFFGEYRQHLRPNFFIHYNLSYQTSSLYSQYIHTVDSTRGLKAWREDNAVAKITATYNYDEDNIFAFGGEYTHDWFGKKSDIGFDEYSRISQDLEKTKWQTNQYAFFGEYQKQWSDRVLMFADFRADKHSYIDWIYSPRVSFIYNIDNTDIFKLNWNRSNRYSDAADLYMDQLQSNAKDDVEEIDVIELSYRKNFTKSFIDLKTFYNEHEVIAFDLTQKEVAPLGRVYSYGGEMEFNYKDRSLFFNIAHSYTKLSKFDLENEQTTIQNVSAMPYGYGDDFASWPKHITKIRFNYNINQNLKWVNSLRVFWNFKGAKDMADYNKATNSKPDTFKAPYYDDGHTRVFEESVYYNTSLIWDVDKKMQIGLYGYNLLGLFNEDLNKRNFFYYTSQYRDMAPSLALSLTYKLN